MKRNFRKIGGHVCWFVFKLLLVHFSPLLSKLVSLRRIEEKGSSFQMAGLH